MCKGNKGGECYRTVCNRKDSYYYNKSTRKYYCQGCAYLINQGAKSYNIEHGVDLCTREGPGTKPFDLGM